MIRDLEPLLKMVLPPVKCKEINTATKS